MRKMFSKNEIEKISKSEVDKVIPATSSASAGQVLTLDEDKKPSWANASALPSVESASAGDILDLDASKNPQWSNFYNKLDGKAVKIMNAPSSSGTSATLTDEQIAQIVQGVFINGNFLGIINPIIFPLGLWGDTTYTGIIVGKDSTTNAYTKIKGCYIDIPNKVIHVEPQLTIEMNTVNGSINVNGKIIPNYPLDTGTFTLKCVDGVLTWVQDV